MDLIEINQILCQNDSFKDVDDDDIRLQSQLSSILNLGGNELKKWGTNHNSESGIS